MCIALIAHYTGPCLGIGQYLDRLLPPLVTELNNQNIEVKILASPNAIAKTPALEKLKDLVYSLSPLDYSPFKRYLWIAKNFTTYCQQQNIKAVVWLSNPLVLPWHPPSIAVIHDVNEWKNPLKYNSRIKTLLRSIIYLDASIYFAQKLILVSKSTENDLFKFRPNLQLKQNIKTIPNGIDSQLVNLPSVPISLSSSNFLLSVGRIDPINKRLPEAIDLVAALRDITHQNWELHLVGGIEQNNQVNAAKFLNSIKDLTWVYYHGYLKQEELAEYYRRSTAVVFLSDNEGFGFPIVEAASFNRWTIVSYKNKSALEVSRNSIISVNPDAPKNAAMKVLQQIQQRKKPLLLFNINKSRTTWQFAAKQYGNQIKFFLN